MRTLQTGLPVSSRLIAAKIVFLFLFFATLATSCMSTRKMDRWIGEHYARTPAPRIKDNASLSFITPEVAKNDKVSQTEKHKTKVIPALFYWHWDRTMQSTMADGIALNQLTAAMATQASLKASKKALEGGRLDVAIKKVPHSFSLRQKENLIYFVVYYVHWSHLWLSPADEELLLTYKFTKEGAAPVTGTIRHKNLQAEMHLKYFQSLRKLTWKYLEQYDAGTRLAGKEAMVQIIADITENASGATVQQR